ncbi:phage SPO1 DNA polymerase-related protein [Haloterrigena salina JCM 13891]|uniref:Type-4 uracil-DNA glycosylase n=1 Tax=Haloterrigena salina JCM 13891 TaxID=1227488 RepID=M0CKI9_9EURY|nr:uracil-DNA glycosylase [Haloterrigena salina]ELZ22882.1 phage SPO1 DNA polymerase-related protein [Haloterrigena salina JCM 13891]
MSDSDTDWTFADVFADALEAVPDEHRDPERFVPGVGPLSADVMLVGEAPGGREVEQGEPFVGQAGQQLDRALESIGHDRRELYITNLVKIRPPENRDPHVDEIEAWWPVLEGELERVDPSVVVPMGSFATAELLETDETITDLHGEEFEREVPPASHASNEESPDSSSEDGADAHERTERIVRPSFHPAAALYDRSKVDAIESDLRAALESA